MANVPNLRFTEFSQDWTSSNLKNLLSLLKDGTHGTHADVNKGVFLLSAKNIKNNSINIDKTDRQISFKDYNKIHANFRLKCGDILITIVGTIGEVALLKHPENITFQRSVAFLRTNEKMYNVFLFEMIQSKKFQKELEARKSISAQPGIYLNDLSHIPIYYPKNKNEQFKIATFINLIDNRIQLQNKIIEDYKILSKAINNRLIGKKQANIKISDCLECISTSKKESEILEANDGPYPSYGANGLIKNIENFEFNQPAISIVKDGAGVSRMSYLVGNYSIVGTLNLLKAKDNFNLKYLYYALKNIDFRSYIVGSGIPHIYFKDYKNELIYVPVNKKTIDTITTCLSSIDELILIEEEKLFKLLLQKKYLLNNMFI